MVTLNILKLGLIRDHMHHYRGLQKDHFYKPQITYLQTHWPAPQITCLCWNNPTNIKSSNISTTWAIPLTGSEIPNNHLGFFKNPMTKWDFNYQPQMVSRIPSIIFHQQLHGSTHPGAPSRVSPTVGRVLGKWSSMEALLPRHLGFAGGQASNPVV